MNIAGLSKHKDELAIFISKQPFDIFCLNETRLDDCSIQVEVPGYNLVRKDRIKLESQWRGVAIYFRNIVPYTNRVDLIPDASEAICLEVSNNETTINFYMVSPSEDAKLTTKTKKSSLREISTVICQRAIATVILPTKATISS